VLVIINKNNTIAQLPNVASQCITERKMKNEKRSSNNNFAERLFCL